MGCGAVMLSALIDMYNVAEFNCNTIDDNYYGRKTGIMDILFVVRHLCSWDNKDKKKTGLQSRLGFFWVIACPFAYGQLTVNNQSYRDIEDIPSSESVYRLWNENQSIQNKIIRH